MNRDRLFGAVGDPNLLKKATVAMAAGSFIFSVLRLTSGKKNEYQPGGWRELTAETGFAVILPKPVPHSSDELPQVSEKSNRI